MDQDKFFIPNEYSKTQEEISKNAIYIDGIKYEFVTVDAVMSME